MKRPLDDILVADFSRVLAGPLCTQMLGDAGARVIKIEEPSRGDETRYWGPPFVGDTSAYFLSLNRNKESLALDLKADADIVRKLIERADVVVDNFLPSQRRANGLHDVRAINPRAIHCSITGYDADTSDADAPGYDLLAQAGAGFMSITGDPDGDPAKAGVATSDILTAQYAYGAIVTALYDRERTNEGARIEVSLFASTLASLVYIAQNTLVTGRDPKRYGNGHPSIVPYQLFHARDRAFVVGAGTDRHFRALCEQVLEEPKLASDARFATNEKRVRNRAKLIPMLESIFRARKASVWVSRCRDAKVPAAIVQTVGEALRSESGQLLVTNGLVRNPVRINGRRRPTGAPPPRLGQHTKKILRELGVTPGRTRAATKPRR